MCPKGGRASARNRSKGRFLFVLKSVIIIIMDTAKLETRVVGGIRGNYFIPSYQRGYRWTKTQVYDLCNDLLEYALRPNKNSKAFYSLQPLIVRKTKQIINGENEDVYEVIDGQQRLTSINILLRYLMKILRYSSDDLKKYTNCVLYHIYKICQ